MTFKRNVERYFGTSLEGVGNRGACLATDLDGLEGFRSTTNMNHDFGCLLKRGRAKS